MRLQLVTVGVMLSIAVFSGVSIAHVNNGSTTKATRAVIVVGSQSQSLVPFAPKQVVPTPAAHAPSRGQTAPLPTAEGHKHVVARPLQGAPIDETDPWTGDKITTPRVQASADTDNPWTGERMGTPSRLNVDEGDPWGEHR